MTWMSLPTTLHSHISGILTQWAFHRVQEHSKRSSDEEVMTYRKWRSYVVKPSRVDLTWPRCPDLSEMSSPTALKRKMDEILTQWDFHRFQEHPKRSLNEEVMAFRSWRSHVVKPSKADLTYRADLTCQSSA